MLPVLPPKQSTLRGITEMVKSDTTRISVSAVAVQPLASVTVTEYVPVPKSSIDSPLAPVLQR